jgi:hypothetical protein
MRIVEPFALTNRANAYPVEATILDALDVA